MMGGLVPRGNCEAAEEEGRKRGISQAEAEKGTRRRKGIYIMKEEEGRHKRGHPREECEGERGRVTQRPYVTTVMVMLNNGDVDNDTSEEDGAMAIVGQ
jgi:hypothetical protein